MPPRNTSAPAAPAAEPTTTAVAFQLPDDVRADLLRAQAASITTAQSLPQVKIMAAGVGRFEFTDTGDTESTFRGIVLGNHPSNVLWDKKFGADVPANDDNAKLPACGSNDGKYGVPRVGFAHEGLNGGVGDGVLKVECARCPYNQFGSGNKLIADKSPKGKAVTNQRKVYVMVEGRELPMELVLPPTSLSSFDEYLASLLNRGMPVQAVVTEFKQRRMEKGTLKWSVAMFAAVETLNQEQFNEVMTRRARYAASINPTAPETAVQASATVISDANGAEEVEGEQVGDEIPF